MKQSYLTPTISFVETIGLDVLAQASTQADSIDGAQSIIGETWFGDIYE